MKTIYIDVSNLMGARGITGIQRVVINVAVRLAKLANEERTFRLSLLSYKSGFEFFVCDTDTFVKRFTLPECRELNCLTERVINIDKLGTDAFWLDLDAVWASLLPRSILYPELWKRNIGIGAYVYDVIVFTHPSYASDDNIMRFPSYLSAVMDYTDIVFTSAENTKRELLQLAEKIGCSPKFKIIVEPLGSDFVSSEEKKGDVDEAVIEIARKDRYLLMVSTIEARKNHKVLLDAFDGGLCNMGYQLVFVGKAGWKVDALLERMEQHPMNGKSLHHLEGLNDESLQYLYENARFVVFPSYTEGFGLATVEALKNGIPTICSDVPVMHEVGGEYCDYFDPDDPAALVALIRHYDENPGEYELKKRSLRSYIPYTWMACTRTIADAVTCFRSAKSDKIAIRQMVYLSAREEDLLASLPYVEAFMPFIEEVLVICPGKMVSSLQERYQGKLRIIPIDEGEVLNGRALPADHTYRNYFLRCLAMGLKEIDDDFIMSDDDYRPMKRIDTSFFFDEGRYNAYYCHDLDLWQFVYGIPTSYDGSMFRTNVFLKEHHYPNLNFASHMPQLIHKQWFQDMLSENPGIESTGLCEWSSYFGYALAHYPDRFSVRPYVVLSWPGLVTDWQQLVYPDAYIFENFYHSLYTAGQLFDGMSTEYGERTLQENNQKAALRSAQETFVKRSFASYREFEERYRNGTKMMPSVMIEITDGQAKLLNPPKQIETFPGQLCKIQVSLITQDREKWQKYEGPFYLGNKRDEASEICWAANTFGRGRMFMTFPAVGFPGKYSIQLYYGFTEGEVKPLGVLSLCSIK